MASSLPGIATFARDCVLTPEQKADRETAKVVLAAIGITALALALISVVGSFFVAGTSAKLSLCMLSLMFGMVSQISANLSEILADAQLEWALSCSDDARTRQIFKGTIFSWF